MKAHYLKTEEFSLIEYARHIKMGGSLENYSKEYRYKFVKLPNKYIDIRNFTITKEEFSKYIPMNHQLDYLVVYKSTKNFNDQLWNLQKQVIFVQLVLLLVFAFISYKLAKNALEPLEESITKLDKFAKDLIHDLNTPLTSIKLNMKLIEKIDEIKEHKAVHRLNKSVYDISELHENLTLLLQEETFQIEQINICDVVFDVVQTYKQIYPKINFIVSCQNFKVKANKNALKQILQNIVSNACKYNNKDGDIKLYREGNSLCIEDNGKGIKEPEKIFDRSYSAEHSSGIGLDIVKRLALAMDIDVKVQTSKKGSTFLLVFHS
jgi:two-component system OmpR family sensor kinase